MKKPNITEGEWTNNREEVRISNDKYKTVATISKKKLGRPDFEQQANAQAISAVPEMLDALIHLRKDESLTLYQEELIDKALKKAGVTDA